MLDRALTPVSVDLVLRDDDLSGFHVISVGDRVFKNADSPHHLQQRKYINDPWLEKKLSFTKYIFWQVLTAMYAKIACISIIIYQLMFFKTIIIMKEKFSFLKSTVVAYLSSMFAFILWIRWITDDLFALGSLSLCHHSYDFTVFINNCGIRTVQHVGPSVYCTQPVWRKQIIFKCVSKRT